MPPPTGCAQGRPGARERGLRRRARSLPADGYLFQEMLRPHAALGRCRPRLSTVRLIILLEDTGPAILHALCKIPVGDNPADNFWRPGNLSAALDPGGRVIRVVQGAGPEQRELDVIPIPAAGFRV